MISRAHMRRQLRANGGITNLRQGYGLGDFVRKLIPNELADLASKAAPFVAPFNPLAAGIMRGVGRYDKRGSLKDALKQGVLTYAGGQGVRMLGGAELQGLQNPFSREAFKSPIGADSPLRNIGRDFMEGMNGSKETSKKVIDSKRKTIDILKDKKLSPMAKVGEVYGGLNPVVKGQLITGGGTFIATLVSEALKDEPEQQPGETMEEYNARRKQKVSSYLRTYLSNTRPTASPKQIDDLVERYTSEYNQGGRVGLAMGGDPLPEDPTKPINPFGPKPTGPVLPDNSMMASSKTYMDYVRAAVELGIKPIRIDEFESLTPIMDVNEILKLTDELNERNKKADGGLMRLNYMIGGEAKQLEAGAPPIMYSGNMDPNQKTGLPSIPGPIQMAEDGPEFDMRENGGFQPLGRQEGKDDVPAMLAKNEFVMTADAVRAAGGGSIQKGAQKMYDTMKKLESRVS